MRVADNLPSYLHCKYLLFVVCMSVGMFTTALCILLSVFRVVDVTVTTPTHSITYVHVHVHTGLNMNGN